MTLRAACEAICLLSTGTSRACQAGHGAMMLFPGGWHTILANQFFDGVFMSSSRINAPEHSHPEPKVADRHVSLGAVIRDTLRARILSGELKTGTRLVEGHLADELGASRIPVRE